MTISNRDQLIYSLANDTSRIIIDKASLSNQVAGRYCSMWRATGQPAQAAIPTTAAVPTSATTGAMGFTNQTAPKTTYFGNLDLIGGNSGQTVEIHDRLAHIGGFVLNSTSSQTVTGMDLSTLAPSSDRLGSANYSDVQWWLEVYSDGGATASNATINVTYDDASTGNLNTVAVGGTIRAGHMFSLTSLIPTGQQGKFIRGINSVILSASTGTAGNFGFTATRPRVYCPIPAASLVSKLDWSGLGITPVPNDSCLSIIILPSTTSSGTLRGGGRLMHG